MTGSANPAAGPFVRRERTQGSIPSTATDCPMPPFQGRDTRLRSLLAEVRVLSVVRRARVRKTGRRYVRQAQLFAGRWRLVTGPLLRGDRKIATTRAPHLARYFAVRAGAPSRPIPAHVRVRCSRLRPSRRANRKVVTTSRGPITLRYPETNRSAKLSSAYTSRVLVHGLESKSSAAGFDSLAVCFARFTRAAVWQQSRWVMPSPKARLLSNARSSRDFLGVVQK